MWPQIASGGRLDSIARRTAEVTAERLIGVSLRRRVDHQHGAVGARCELVLRLFLGQIEAPRERRDRHAAAEPEEAHAADLPALAVEHRRARPRSAGAPQRRVGLVVPGHEHARRLDRSEDVDRAPQTEMERGEVAGADHEVGVARAPRERPRAPAVTV
jgi:hypothetical protein